jgi:hypothetical protein
MVVYKDEIYIGGYLTKIGSISVNRIARWDGVNWKNVGTGVTGWLVPEVTCMAVFQDELYVGGGFWYAGGKESPFIAKWDGEKWDSLTLTVNDFVSKMAVDTSKNVLYISGGFDRAGDKEVNGVAMWDGKEWHTVGTDNIPSGYALAVYRGDLYSGCNYTTIANNGEYLNYLARWDGKEWHAVGDGTKDSGPNGGVTSLCVFNDELYVGGSFDKVSFIPANKIARWYMPKKKSDNKYLGYAYPNPTNQTITIPYQIDYLKEGELKIFSIEGKEIIDMPLNKNEHEVTISLAGCNNGIYLYTLYLNNRASYSKKLVLMGN